MEHFKNIKWIVSQKPGTLGGLLLFAISYMIFLTKTSEARSYTENFLFAAIFLTSSLLIAHSLTWLTKKVTNKVQILKVNSILRDPIAAKILKLINEAGEEILSNELFNSGLASPIDINQLSANLDIPVDDIRYFIIRFREANWLIYSPEGDVYGVSDYGIKIMRKKRLI